MSTAARLPSIGPYELPQTDEIPEARAPWRPEKDRIALLIHDMQNYFAAAFTAGASPITPVIDNIARLARAFRASGLPVIYTGQQGDQDPADRGLQRDLWGPGMTSAPEHQDIVTGLQPAPEDILITKHRYSAFQRTDLELLLREHGRDQLVVCGVYAHIGCLLTTAEAFQRDIEPFLVADAIADFSRERHDYAVRYVAESCGVALATNDLEALLQ
ncbi:MAG: isochorismatase family protein [Pseudomonadota bacterium]